jgi:hypothetical protein
MRGNSLVWPGLVLCLTAGLLAGCGKKHDDEPKGGPSNPVLGPPQPGAGGLRRAVDRPKVLNELRQLGTLYKAYSLEPGRHTLQGFKAYIQRDARDLVDRLDKHVYVLLVTDNPSSTNILAYEKAADGSGNHYVAMGDASVPDPMSTQQLEQALQKQGAALEK